MPFSISILMEFMSAMLRVGSAPAGYYFGLKIFHIFTLKCPRCETGFSGFGMKHEKIKILIIGIIIFLSIVPVVLFVYIGFSNARTYINRNNYKPGLLLSDSLECGSGYGGDSFDCIAFGKIEHIESSVNLGVNPNNSGFYRERANLSLNKYPVFYKEDGNQTILRKNEQTIFNGFPFLRKALFQLIYPLIIFPTLIIYFRNLKRQIWNKRT